MQWNGGAEDTASGDDLVVEMSDMHRSAGSWGSDLAEQVRPDRIDAVLEASGVQVPQRGRQ